MSPPRRWIAVLSASLLATALAGSAVADDAEAERYQALKERREERDEKVERYHMRALTQKRINAAQELLEVGDNAGARERLERMKLSRLNPYERALIYRLLAHASYGAEDPAAAVDYFRKAVDEEALPLDEEASARFSIAQISASMEEWAQVETALLEWFPYVERPNSLAYYLLAISRYQRDQFDAALEPALQAIERSKQPQERWLQLVAALYLEREDFDSAVPILEELVTRFGKKPYWVQLSLIYSARGNYERALRVQQLAYAQGLLVEGEELRRLARSYLFHQLPYPAAQVLARAIEEGRIEPDGEVLELIGNAWIAAREYDKSIEPLQRAAELADDGRLYLRLGQVRVQREDWKEATALIQRALEKGGLPDEGKAHLLLGISYFSDDDPASARTAFRRASAHESTKKEARAWLDHIARQRQEG